MVPSMFTPMLNVVGNLKLMSHETFVAQPLLLHFLQLLLCVVAGLQQIAQRMSDDCCTTCCSYTWRGYNKLCNKVLYDISLRLLCDMASNDCHDYHQSLVRNQRSGDGQLVTLTQADKLLFFSWLSTPCMCDKQ